MSEEKENINNTYFIPTNFEESGGMFGGAIKFRNGIEAIIILVVGFYGIRLLLGFFSIVVQLVVFIVLIMPLVFMAVIGLRGDSLTEFLSNFMKFRKKRRVLDYKLLSKEDSVIKEPENIASKLKLSRLKKNR